jgi:hypothetical protein
VVNDAMGNKWPRSGIGFAAATVAILIFAGNQDCEQGSDHHHGVAPCSGLDVLRRRLGERVLDIDIRQRAAVLRLSAGACAPTTSTWFLYTLECRAFEIFRIGPRRNLGHFCWSL